MKSCQFEPSLLVEYYGLIRDSTAWRNLAKRSNPDTFSNFNRRAEEGECRIIPVVIAGEEIYTLAYAGIWADADRRVIVDPDLFTDPNMIANLEKPRGLNIDPRLDYDAVADLRAEHPEHSRLGWRRHQAEQATAEDYCVYEIPESAEG